MHLNITGRALEQVRLKGGTVALDFIAAIG